LRILLAIDVHRNKDSLGDDQGTAIRFEGTEETAAVALVAHAGAERLNEEEQGIGVAVDANLADTQDVAAGLTLFPEAVAGAGKEVDLAGALRSFKGFGVQVAEHEDFASLVVLNHSWDESSEFFECQFHDSLPKNKNPPGNARQRAD
jgi:hypothetical protein